MKLADYKLTDEDKANQQRMLAAQHAMQSGVLHSINTKGEGGPTPGLTHECGPKHLRVGVNTALVECAALAALLTEKGIITPTEYYQTLADAYEAEQKRYEERFGVKFA